MQRSRSMNAGRGTAGSPARHEPSRQRLITRALLLMAVMVMLASCGGDGGEDGASDQAVAVGEDGTGGEDGSGSVSSVSYGSVFGVAFDVTDRFGGMDGYAAVVTALDRGYTLGQLGVGSGDLGRDGWIVTDGEQLRPDGSPQKLLGPAPEAGEEGLDGEGEPMGRQTSTLKQLDERHEYVEFVGETLDEMWVRIEGRVKWDLPGEEVDRIVDDVLEQRRIDAEFDALFADEPDELEDLEESEVWATTLTLLLVGQGYSLQDALQAGLLGTFEARGPCLLIPGATRTTPLRLEGCELIEFELDNPAPTEEPGDSVPEEAPTEDPVEPQSSTPVLSVTSYSLVSTGTPTSEDHMILDGSLDVEVDGDVLRFTGQLTWDDPLSGNSSGIVCWGTDTFAFAGEAPFTGELLVPLAFTESLDATLNGDCGPLTYDHRIPDHLDNEDNLWLQATISDGALVGGDYDGAVVLEPAG